MNPRHRSVISTLIQEAVRATALTAFLIAAVLILAAITNWVSNASGWVERGIIVGIVLGCVGMGYVALRAIGKVTDR